MGMAGALMRNEVYALLLLSPPQLPPSLSLRPSLSLPSQNPQQLGSHRDERSSALCPRTHVCVLVRRRWRASVHVWAWMLIGDVREGRRCRRQRCRQPATLRCRRRPWTQSSLTRRWRSVSPVLSANSAASCLPAEPHPLPRWSRPLNILSFLCVRSPGSSHAKGFGYPTHARISHARTHAC